MGNGVMPSKFLGLWPALLTPLDGAGNPALAVIEQLTDHLVRDGLDGLYVVGSTGQWPLLTYAERCVVAETVVKASAGRVPIMVHVGAASTAEAVALARHAQHIGADAVSAVTPIYYAHSADVVFEHYRAIGSATDLPLFVYHLSQVNQLTIGPEEYVRRLLALPNIAGMKITDRDLYMLGLIHAHAGERLRLFSGADEVMCQAVLSGAIGAIGTFYNLWGPACRRARRAFTEGDVAGGTAFMLRFQRAIAQVLQSGSIWTFLRQAMRLKYGIDIGMPRPPLGSTDKPWVDEEVRRVIALVDDADSPLAV
jgi:N-acetylneuraminate lyase